MNLFSVSLKNIKNSFSNYIMYFISIVFSVFIFFTFKSIQYNEALSVLSDSRRSGINGASIIIAFFSLVFIYYSNAFFLNRRKEEIGTYSLLGMRKIKIAKLLFYETIIISIGAIGIGIVIGFLFSKIMTMLLIKLMGELIIVKINLSIKALIQTIMVFTLIFIVISIRNVAIIKSKSLISLFKNESEKSRGNKFSFIFGIIGSIMIIVSYMFVTSKFIERNVTMAPLVLITIIPGTFLFFSSVLNITLNLTKKNKNFYYKGRNLIAFSQLNYNIKNNSRILSIIAILIATSITILGFNISYYYDISRNIDENYKYNYNINADNKYVNKKIDKVMNDNKNDIVLDKIVKLIKSESHYKSTYIEDGVVEETSEIIEIMKESDFVDLYKPKEYEKLKSDRYVYYNSDVYRDIIYKSMEGLRIYIKSNEFIVQKEFTKPILNAQSTFNIVVVKDNIYDQLYSNNIISRLRLIKLKSKDSLDLSNKLENIVNDNMKFSYPFNFTSKIKSYTELMHVGGLMLFIGIFLSIVFLLCTGSIILFRQLSSIYDDKERYMIIKMIGADNKDIEKILSKQLKMIFILPFIIGAIHSLFAMVILQKIISRSIIIPVTITLILYLLGYYIYYLITLKYAKDMIINEK